MYGYVYKTTNTKNGKIYVGKRKRKPSLGMDNNYLGSGTLLLKDVEKYGKDCFETEIIEWCKDLETIDERERFWIEELKTLYTYGNYNMTKGGTGGGSVGRYNNQSGENSNKFGKNNPFYGKRHSEETKMKISEAKKGTPPPNKGKTYTEEEKERLYYNKTFQIQCKRCECIFVAKASSYLWCPSCKIKNEIDDNNKEIERMLRLPNRDYYINKRRDKNKSLQKELYEINKETYMSL